MSDKRQALRCAIRENHLRRQPVHVQGAIKLKLAGKPVPIQSSILFDRSPPSGSAAKQVEIRPAHGDLEPEEAVWTLYRRWCIHYNIGRTPEEMHERFNIFKKNACEVFEMNQMDPSWPFHLSSSCDEKDLFEWYADEETTPIPTEKDMKSDEAVLDLYYRWCLYHQILRTPQEMQQRLKYFKKSAARAIKMNKKDPSCLSKWCDKIDLRGMSFGGDMSLTPTKGDVESDKALWDLYHRWCLRYKIHRTPEEMKMRFTSFKNTVVHVFEMSKDDPDMQYRLSYGCDETDYPVPEVAVVPTERDLKSGNALLGLYHRYCLHRKIQRAPEEKKWRLDTFKKCVKYVFEKNKKDPSGPFFLGDICDGGEMPQEAAQRVRIRIQPTCWDLESEEAVRLLYRRWCLNHYGISTDEVMHERLKCFKKHARKVLSHNRKCPDKTALSRWADGAATCCIACSKDDTSSGEEEEEEE